MLKARSVEFVLGLSGLQVFEYLLEWNRIDSSQEYILPEGPLRRQAMRSFFLFESSEEIRKAEGGLLV